MKRLFCRACDSCSLHEVLNLGSQPPSNALLDSPDDNETLWPLRLVVCRDCNLLQLSYDVPHEILFNERYPYFSGQSKQWVEHCKQYAEMVINARRLVNKESVVYEIGGNDGTLLANFRNRAFFLANYEPSVNVADAARRNGVPTVTQAWRHNIVTPYKADLLIANNVMAHDPDLQGFVEGVAKNLAAGGTFTAEFPWALNLIEQCQFDTIYHEHYSYLSLHALIPLFLEHRLRIYDVEEVPTHGGSLRIYVSQNGAKPLEPSVVDLLAREAKLADLGTYYAFAATAKRIHDDLLEFINEEGPIYAYGAAAKGNTLINWLKLDDRDILAVGDTTPAKQDKFLPGSRIPVLTEEELLAAKPEYVLILPWNWTDEIVDKLHCIRGWGGKFVTAIPNLKVF